MEVNTSSSEKLKSIVQRVARRCHEAATVEQCGKILKVDFSPVGAREMLDGFKKDISKVFGQAVFVRQTILAPEIARVELDIIQPEAIDNILLGNPALALLND